MSITSILYKMARLSADARSLRSPETAARRIKNKAIGRALGKAGVWGKLWR